ncbi:hypothetical protein RLOC_00006314 [Lonchura striata]|uniref:Uncharacterized protein n=1 Tax=Lonchura striata TaxID=40157 RepID=A0A218UC47_9PASE|nr:hypothetical protein RLOC_00006314 [Lonchura striata domestica]
MFQLCRPRGGRALLGLRLLRGPPGPARPLSYRPLRKVLVANRGERGGRHPPRLRVPVGAGGFRPGLPGRRRSLRGAAARGRAADGRQSGGPGHRHRRGGAGGAGDAVAGVGAGRGSGLRLPRRLPRHPQGRARRRRPRHEGGASAPGAGGELLPRHLGGFGRLWQRGPVRGEIHRAPAAHRGPDPGSIFGVCYSIFGVPGPQVTPTGMWSTSTSATARCSAGTRRSWRSPRPRGCRPSSAPAWPTTPCAWPGRWATRAPAPWSSWWTRAGSITSSRSTRGCRWSTRSPRRSPTWTWCTRSCRWPRAARCPSWGCSRSGSASTAAPSSAASPPRTPRAASSPTPAASRCSAPGRGWASAWTAPRRSRARSSRRTTTRCWSRWWRTAPTSRRPPPR